MPDHPPNCCLCGSPCEPWHDPPTGYGHNPDPFGEDGDRCCYSCNIVVVIPARLNTMSNYPTKTRKNH